MSKFIIGLLALTVAGCGGGDESPEESGGDDFALEAEATCVEAAEAIRDVNLELGYAQGDEAIAYVEQLLDARQSALSAFESLDPPADLADTYDGYLAARRTLVDSTEEFLTARENGDESAIEAGDAAISEAVKAINVAGTDLDIDACAAVLPGDDAEAAEEVLLEYSTTTDSSAICEPGGIATEAFVDGFGGVEACLEEQERIIGIPGRLPEDIKVSEVNGVDDVVAAFEYAEVGGKADGEPFVAQVYYVDGEWRLYSTGGG